MSDKLPQQPQNEEVDLGQLFNAIGRLFEKLFKFIGRIFKAIFSAIIYTIKPLVVYFKIVAVALIIAAVVGYVYEETKAPLYYSNMVVKPHFDSKYQLFSNIDYFNSLIKSNNFSELSSIFEIDSSEAKVLKGFELKAGPETQNDLFIEYDEYVKSIDTSLVDELSYVDYVQNRDLLSGRIFSIKATAHKSDIFTHLQKGFKKTFINEFSIHQKKVRDTTAYINRLTLTTQLDRLDSIQKTYLEVIRNESKKSKQTLSLSNSLPLQEEKTATKEYDLFLKEQDIRARINKLDQEVAEQNTYFDILSGFNRIGIEERSIQYRYSILFPILTVIAFLLLFLVLKAFNYIKNYE
ncbi:hypothetical protein DFQ11_101732 [Winogradskyella epiphytica]|uniref:Subunit length determinant protein n=1 Tax=Winogradskyella epiphytica TaxID=262005 RepID=A0A2V4XJ05_9FLAO|nr:hypothetical protein [Winogradskyella epiphytica]PYE83300.1 hypothetical protein DFQ11_101732 [Winogradskyella epiphytica]GGW57155.1 hypothetical protein GCM10008085_05940 [Winogradskyella epiphytica]